MKKIMLFSGLALGLGLASCREIPVPEDRWGNGSTIMANYPQWASSAAELPSIVWSEGDQIHLYIDVNDTINKGLGSSIDALQTRAYSIVSGGGSTSATFSAGSDRFTIGDGANPCRIFYAASPVKPVDNATGVNKSSCLNATGTCAFTMEQTQTQDVTSASAEIRKYLLMWADPIPDGEGVSGNLNFQFRHLCAVLGFKIATLPAGISVTDVEITEVDPATNAPLTGKANNLCFMTKMDLNRNSSGGEYRFGTTGYVDDKDGNIYYVNSMKVSMFQPAGGAGFIANIAVIPHDFMLDINNKAVNAAKGLDAKRNFTVKVYTTNGVIPDSYSFKMVNASSYWEPGHYYEALLSITTDMQPDSAGGPPVMISNFN